MKPAKRSREILSWPRLRGAQVTVLDCHGTAHRLPQAEAEEPADCETCPYRTEADGAQELKTMYQRRSSCVRRPWPYQPEPAMEPGPGQMSLFSSADEA